MRALPSSLSQSSGESVTGMSCPECSGVLGVTVEKREGLRFRCRIGHSYSVEEVIIAKERLAEDHIWEAVTALDELATFLRELRERTTDEKLREVYERRAASASHEGDALRQIVQENAPITLKSDPDPDVAHQ